MSDFRIFCRYLGDVSGNLDADVGTSFYFGLCIGRKLVTEIGFDAYDREIFFIAGELFGRVGGVPYDRFKL